MIQSEVEAIGFPKILLLLPLILFTAPGSGDDLESPRSSGPWVNTSFLLNGDFEFGPAFWDRKGRQEPAKGSHMPYDPDNDPGLNKFDASNNCVVIKPSEELIQRILLSPGDNVVSGWSSYYIPKKERWSTPEPFHIDLPNPHDVHVMHRLELVPFKKRKTRFTGIRAACLTEPVSLHQLRRRVREELGSILRLHLDTSTVIDPPSETLFPFPGMHFCARFDDYDDLDSWYSVRFSITPSPSAELYLKAALHDFDEYRPVAFRHALGVLSTLCPCGSGLLPFRYDFEKGIWEAPEVGSKIHLPKLLSYLCDCWECFRDPLFLEAAELIAWEVLLFNWWNQNADPEGLYFVSDTFELDVQGKLHGAFTARAPLHFEGAPVSDDNKDHRLLHGAAALSGFVRTCHDAWLTGAELDIPLLKACLDAVDRSIDSFCVYADKFNTSWVDDFVDPQKLTASWWSNYDRRDDFAGYNLGECLTRIYGDQRGIFGAQYVFSKAWVGKMRSYMEDFQKMWDMNTKKGGVEAGDSDRFYKSFYHLWAFDEHRDWTRQYIDTYLAGLNQLIKGSIQNGHPPVAGAWPLWDWGPYKPSNEIRIGPPCTIFAWGAHVYEMCRDLDGYEEEMRTFLTTASVILQMMDRTSKGEAGYRTDVSVPSRREGGGEYRVAGCLFKMYAALE